MVVHVCCGELRCPPSTNHRFPTISKMAVRFSLVQGWRPTRRPSLTEPPCIPSQLAPPSNDQRIIVAGSGTTDGSVSPGLGDYGQSVSVGTGADYIDWEITSVRPVSTRHGRRVVILAADGVNVDVIGVCTVYEDQPTVVNERIDKGDNTLSTPSPPPLLAATTV